MEYPVHVQNFPLKYHSDFEADDHIVKVALRLAQKAHSGVPRGKADPAIPYIVHPIMVHDLLKYFGETNPMVLAAGLLHDTIEDYEPYENDPEILYNELCEGFKEEGVKDYESVASYIMMLCGKLTNAEAMTEGKRTWQVFHASTLPETVARIKILDQLASVIDGCVMPEPDDMNRSDARKWCYKALNVVKAAADDRPRLDFWRNLYKVVFSYRMKMLNQLEMEEKFREEFNFEALVEQARNMVTPPTEEIVSTVDRENCGALERGIVQVGFAANGNIKSFATIADLNGLKDSPANAATIHFIGKLEAFDEMTRVTSLRHRRAI